MFLRSQADVRKNLKDFIVAKDTRGQIIGCAALHQYSSPLGEILSVAVLPEFQGEGIGNRLMQNCIQQADVNGIEQLWLATVKPGESFTYLPSLEDILSKWYGAFGRLRQVRKPGASFEYNNGNYVLLELLIEEVTQLGFASHMQRIALDPVGMEVSTYPPAGDQLATPYDQNKRPLPHDHADVGLASGGLYSTATDLARFVAATMRGPDGSEPGKGIVSPETVARMIAPAEETGGSYGLGYKMLPVSEALTLIGHDGSNPGWKATFMAAPQKGVGIVVLTNSDAGSSIVADLVCTWAEWETDIELNGLCKGTRPIPGR